jgi:hypothetical protein
MRGGELKIFSKSVTEKALIAFAALFAGERASADATKVMRPRVELNRSPVPGYGD